jgi:hypothetical protein
MPKREAAREESRFARGEVGVDGADVEEQVDQAEAERDKAREQFLRGKSYLGREFLTWLLYSSESGEPIVRFDDQPVTLVFTDRLVLRGIAGEVVELTVKGAMAPYSPIVRQAMDRGLLIHQGRLRLAHGERSYEATLDAEHLAFKGGKVPDLLSEEDDDGIHERLMLAEQLALLVHALLEQFLKLRSSKRWAKDVVPAMKAWMAEVPEKKRKAG